MISTFFSTGRTSQGDGVLGEEGAQNGSSVAYFDRRPVGYLSNLREESLWDHLHELAKTS